MGRRLDSASMLMGLASTHDRILIFYSGGKDSLAVVDMASRLPWRVICVHMYMCPGLAVVEERLDLARRRYGVEVYMTPHWGVSVALRRGLYCPPCPTMPELGLPAVVASAREATGVEAVLVGGKRADGMWRRRRLANDLDRAVHYPIRGWSKWDVLAYLKSQGLDPGEKFDVGLTSKCLLWLARDHPEDFRRVCECYPFAEAVVWRERWYGKQEG